MILVMCAQSLSHVQHFVTPWAFCPWDFPGKNTGVGFQKEVGPSPGDLPYPGLEPLSPVLAGRFFTSKPPDVSNLSHDYTVILSKNIWFPKCVLWRSVKTP